MKAQELRIGNKLSHNNDIITVYGIDEKNIQILKPNMNNYFHKVPIEDLKPIPLTEEIIFKCGFKEDDLFYHKDDVIISNFYEDYFTLDSYQDSKIRYLHQLQNLYFILTEKELEIKL